jgi:hypothetical protein
MVAVRVLSVNNFQLTTTDSNTTEKKSVISLG